MGTPGPPGRHLGGRAGRGRRLRQRERQDRPHPVPRAHRLQAVRTGGERQPGALRPRLPHGGLAGHRGEPLPHRGRLLAVGRPRQRGGPLLPHPARLGHRRRRHRGGRRHHLHPDAGVGSQTYGILSNNWLDKNAQSVRYEVTIDTSVDGEFTYIETTVIKHAKVPERGHPHRPQHAAADRRRLGPAR